jgi:hypothetical protein
LDEIATSNHAFHGSSVLVGGKTAHSGARRSVRFQDGGGGGTMSELITNLA